MKKPVSVADYLAGLIDRSEKTQIEIANDCGYAQPNIITMFKQGRTKVPLAKVAPLARTLNVDPVYLLRLVMQEYMPETWEAIAEIVGVSLVTSNEAKILDIIRTAASGKDLAPETSAEVSALKACVQEWKARAKAPVSRKSDEPRPVGRPKGMKTAA